MATECRERKRNWFVKYEIHIIFISLVIAGLILGLVIGRATAKPETITETKTIEVPTYEVDKLPEVSEVDYYDVPLSHSLQRYLFEICADNNVPVTLILAMIEQESQFNPEAVSKTNDYGLLQINEINHKELEEKYRTADMLDPYQNVYCGVRIINSYLKKYEGDYTKALMAYNMGEYGAKKAWKDNIYSTEYTKKIITLWKKYEEMNDGRSNDPD